MMMAAMQTPIDWIRSPSTWMKAARTLMLTLPSEPAESWFSAQPMLKQTVPESGDAGIRGHRNQGAPESEGAGIRGRRNQAAPETGGTGNRRRLNSATQSNHGVEGIHTSYGLEKKNTNI